MIQNKILNKANFKIWSRLGMRATFGVAALELGNTVDKLMVLTGDVSTSAGLDRFKKKFPEKYLDVGIAEQNLIGIGAGLASEGFNVITTTFAPFQTIRCCEQIKVNLGYMKQKICMVGLASGLALGTHKLVVNGTDAVGNTYSTDQSFSFTVVAREAYKLTLNPGTNFVSLPGTPTDSAIGTVLAGTNATEVLSWQGGKWQIAAVTAEGKWIGGITNINSESAYLIKTATFDSISVEILPRSFEKAPPTVTVKKGWNMVPIIDLALQAQGTTITEDVYFGSLSDGTGTLWKAAYTFDTASQVWSKLLPGSTPAVETVAVGKGYWLWATAAGDLVP